MGFYSFYRIFKDIIRSIFGCKAWRITLIIVIFALAIILVNNKVNAAEPINYTVDYYTSAETTPAQGKGHYYWFVPVFANSSYSISWPSGTELSFGFIDSLSRYVPNSNNDFYYNSYNFIANNDQGSYGYFATKDGYLVIDQWKYTFPDKVNLTITTDYDYTSNLATIHNDLLNLMNAIQGSDAIDSTISYSTINGLSVSQGNGNGTFISGNSIIIYFPLDDTRYHHFDFTVTVPSNMSFFYHTYGYCNAIPSSGVSYSALGYLKDSTQYLNVTTTVPKGAKYFFIRLSSSSSFTLNNYSVSYGGLNEVNQQVIDQAQQTRDTMTDSSISQTASDYTLPTDSTTDITQEGFNTIFDRIRSTFTSGSSTPIVVTIPFTNKSFTISYNTVYGSANLGIVRSIIESFWWFVISLFICKDIFKKIEKLKTGNIEFTETTNIKEDIL